VSAQDAEIVRRAIEAGLSEPPDVETLCEVLDPEHVLTTNWGVGGTEHHGVQGTLAALADMSAVWDSWHQELERVFDAGEEGVVALLRFRAKGRESAVPVEAPWAMVATVRNGRVLTSRVFLTHDEALEAVGLGR
jgi:ketosteroid isomerase-like protein